MKNRGELRGTCNVRSKAHSSIHYSSSRQEKTIHRTSPTRTSFGKSLEPLQYRGSCLKHATTEEHKISIEGARRGGLSRKLLPDETHRQEIENNDNGAGRFALFRLFMDECNRNFEAQPNRRRYSEATCDISELLRTTSRKTYHLLRVIMPLPSTSVLFRKYSHTVKQRKKGHD